MYTIGLIDISLSTFFQNPPSNKTPHFVPGEKDIRIKSLCDVLVNTPEAIVFELNGRRRIPKLTSYFTVSLFPSAHSVVFDQRASGWEDRRKKHYAGLEAAFVSQQQPHWVWGQVLRKGTHTLYIHLCSCCQQFVWAREIQLTFFIYDLKAWLLKLQCKQKRWTSSQCTGLEWIYHFRFRVYYKTSGRVRPHFSCQHQPCLLTLSPVEKIQSRVNKFIIKILNKINVAIAYSPCPTFCQKVDEQCCCCCCI